MRWLVLAAAVLTVHCAWAEEKNAVPAPPRRSSEGLSYTYKLWLAHGVTTVRGVPLAPWTSR
jgi:hypothetical protein